MNYTPKVRQKKSNFWGIFIMKLTYEDKVQIYELRKQGKNRYYSPKLKQEIINRNLNVKISVDGGINEEVLTYVKEADILVSSSFILSDLDKNVDILKNS